MDNELKLIQADLDAALERLAEYIGTLNDDDIYRFGDELRDDREIEARDTVIMYLTQGNGKSLELARDQLINRSIPLMYRRSHFVRLYGEQKGRLLSALEAISHGDHRSSRLLNQTDEKENNLQEQPLSRFHFIEPEDMEVLANMADRYLNKQDQYPGEYGGNQVIKRSGKRSRYTKEQKERAVDEYIRLRKEHGKQAYPLERETCQPIANKHGIESGQAIVDLIRKRLDMIYIAEGDPKIGTRTAKTTLREYLSIND